MLHALRSMLAVPVPNLPSGPNTSTDKLPKKGTQKIDKMFFFGHAISTVELNLFLIFVSNMHRTFLLSPDLLNYLIMILFESLLCWCLLDPVTLHFFYHQMSPKPFNTPNLQRGRYLCKQINP